VPAKKFRAFRGLAGSPLAKTRRGRPPKHPGGAMSPAERKRLSRAKQEREQKIEELRREQATDKATGGRGKGMFLKDAPAGEGRVSVYDPEKLALVSDMAQIEIDETGDGRMVRPAGQGLSGFEQKKDGGIDPKCFEK